MTSLFILAALLVISAYDIFAYLVGGLTNTISYKIYTASYSKPAGAIIPFLAGGLTYHLFIGN